MKRTLVWTCGLCLLRTPLAHAEPGASDLTEARALHEEAQARYDVADYLGAVRSWTLAYQALPNTPRSAKMKPLILYNMATALQRAYELDNDVKHLRRARILLESFAEAIPELFTDPQERAQEEARVEQTLASLDALVAEHEGEPDPSHAEAPTTPEEAPTDAAEAPEDPSERDTEPPKTAVETTNEVPSPEVRAAPADTRRSTPANEAARTMVIAGSSLTSVGFATTVGTFVAVALSVRANDLSDIDDDDLTAREQQFDRGELANRLSIAGAVVSIALVASGIPLWVVGARRQKRWSTGASMSSREASVWVRGRF